MENRIEIDSLEPGAYRAMYALAKYLEGSELSMVHRHLINMRASQINGCAYCINMHHQEALADGETQQRLILLDTWRETELFTQEERVVLALTEEVTMIGDKGLTSETYGRARELFAPNYIAQLIMAVVTINAWNRLAISTHKKLD
jgi:AhpD family alkylhydroperoxidase